MPYVAGMPEHYIGRRVGTGQCVAYVQAAAGAPETASWTAGVRVKGAALGTIAKGTVIATMVHGHYPNHTHGNHVAIYLSHDAFGIRVLDQWSGHAVHERVIPFGGGSNASNDGDAYYVVE